MKIIITRHTINYVSNYCVITIFIRKTKKYIEIINKIISKCVEVILIISQTFDWLWIEFFFLQK